MISNCLLWYSDWIEIIPCHTMLYHVIPCHSMWFYVILCYTVYWTEDIEDLELNWSETGNCCGPSDICADVAAARQVWVCKQHRGPFRRGIAGQSMSAQTSSNEEFLLMFFFHGSALNSVFICHHLPIFHRRTVVFWGLLPRCRLGKHAGAGPAGLSKEMLDLEDFPI